MVLRNQTQTNNDAFSTSKQTFHIRDIFEPAGFEVQISSQPHVQLQDRYKMLQSPAQRDVVVDINYVRDRAWTS